MRGHTTRYTAVTLLELLVVMTIIVVLCLVSIPMQGYFREQGAGVSCINNLRQIGVATMQFAGENRNELPYYWYPVGNDSGNGANTGAWYYNLAPYLNVPRTEVAAASASLERTYLGSPAKRLSSPCVFTCPGHRKTESKLYWSPNPMSWPAERPVSYAPPLEMRGDRVGRGPSLHWTGVPYYPVRLSDIKAPSQKIWISESPVPTVLNLSDSRWDTEYVENWPRQGFSRHNKGGNALFYDGHVQWFPLSTFIAPKSGSIAQMVRLYFHPYRNPSEDL